MPLDLAAIAREMKAAQDDVRQLAPFTSRIPGFDERAAYRVAQLVHEARLAEGWVPVGRKLGFTNAELWDTYGVRAPIWAHVYDRTVVMASGAQRRCSLARYAEPKIEPEIVLHLRAAPEPGGDEAHLLGCIDWFAHGFEIVQSHFPGWSFAAPDTIADAALHGTLLVGEPRPVAALGPDLLAALRSFSIDLSCDGARRDRGRGANVLGGPLAALAHLVAVLANDSHAEPLRAGELVTTGTLTGAWPVHAGETWTTALDGLALPGMSVTFDA